MLTGASADPEVAAVGYIDGTVVLVTLAGELDVLDLGDDGSDIALSFLDGEPVVAAALPECVAIFRPRSNGGRVQHLSGHEGRVTKVALFSDAGEQVAVSADERGNVHRWHLPEGTRISVRRAHRKSVHTLLPGPLSAARTTFLTASDDRQAIIHDLRDADRQCVLAPHAGWIDKVAYADPGDVADIVLVTDRVGLTVWDVANGTVVTRVSVDGPGWLAGWSGGSRGPVIAAVRARTGQIMLWTPTGTGLIDPPLTGQADLITLAGDRIRQRPVLRAARGDQLIELTRDGRWINSGPAFPSPVANIRPWIRCPGAVIVLADGSIWLVKWL